MCQLRNMPHRGTGALYYAHIKCPWREDYCVDYLQAYFEYVDGGMMQEGQPRPIVDMYAVVMAREFPRSKGLKIIRDIVMNNHQAWLNKREQEDAK